MFNYTTTTLRLYDPPEDDEDVPVADFVSHDDLREALVELLGTEAD